MKITEVRVKAVNSKNGKLKGWASVTFDDAFVVHNLKIIQGRNGRFVAMPNRKTRDGFFRDIAHPIKNDVRQEIEDLVLEEFDVKRTQESNSFTTYKVFDNDANNNNDDANNNNDDDDDNNYNVDSNNDDRDYSTNVQVENNDYSYEKL